jgi:hypothetical protein
MSKNPLNPMPTFDGPTNDTVQTMAQQKLAREAIEAEARHKAEEAKARAEKELKLKEHK